MGLGSALYAMAKADGRLQSEETETLRMLLLNDPDARPALEAFDIQDKYDVPAEEAYEYALRRFQAHFSQGKRVAQTVPARPEKVVKAF